MALNIKMQGDLTSVHIPGDFDDTVAGIQAVHNKGFQFLIMEKDDGTKIGFYLNNLNSIEEVDDDAF